MQVPWLLPQLEVGLTSSACRLQSRVDALAEGFKHYLRGAPLNGEGGCHSMRATLTSFSLASLCYESLPSVPTDVANA